MKKTFLILLLLTAASPVFMPVVVHAQTPTTGGCQNGVCTYVPLEPLPCPPGVPNCQSGTTSFSQYVSTMFRLFITLGALFAVLTLVIAGISYMTSQSPLDLSKARDRAKKALYGLLLLGACWLILYTINPNLLRFDIFAADVPAVSNSGAQPLSDPKTQALNALGVDTTSCSGILTSSCEATAPGGKLSDRLWGMTPENFFTSLQNAPFNAENCTTARNSLALDGFWISTINSIRYTTDQYKQESTQLRGYVESCAMGGM